MLLSSPHLPHIWKMGKGEQREKKKHSYKGTGSLAFFIAFHNLETIVLSTSLRLGSIPGSWRRRWGWRKGATCSLSLLISSLFRAPGAFTANDPCKVWGVGGEGMIVLFSKSLYINWDRRDWSFILNETYRMWLSMSLVFLVKFSLCLSSGVHEPCHMPFHALYYLFLGEKQPLVQLRWLPTKPGNAFLLTDFQSLQNKDHKNISCPFDTHT